MSDYTETMPSTKLHPLLDKKVIIRAPGSGVFIGILENVSPHGHELSDAQRIWKWKGALDILTIAENGVSSANISPKVGQPVIIPDARETIGLSKQSISCFEKISPWSR